jgi:hypothetical protein
MSQKGCVCVGKSYAVAVELKGAEEILLVSLSTMTSAIFKCDVMLHPSSVVAYRATY